MDNLYHIHRQKNGQETGIDCTEVQNMQNDFRPEMKELEKTIKSSVMRSINEQLYKEGYITKEMYDIAKYIIDKK